MNSIDLNYSLVIGEDMRESIHKIYNPFGTNELLPYIVFDKDAFVFDETMFKKGKEVIWEFFNESMIGVENIYVLITGNCFDYTQHEIDMMWFMNELFSIAMNKPKIFFIKLEADDYQEMANVPADILIEKSGFLCKTEGENSIFNAVVFHNKQAYLITIILKGFIGKKISQSIIDIFEIALDFYCRDHNVKVPNFEFESSNNRFLDWLPWRKKKEPFVSLREVVNPWKTQTFKQYLSNNSDINDAFNELEFKNILVNFRVLGRDFLL